MKKLKLLVLLPLCFFLFNSCEKESIPLQQELQQNEPISSYSKTFSSEELEELLENEYGTTDVTREEFITLIDSVEESLRNRSKVSTPRSGPVITLYVRLIFFNGGCPQSAITKSETYHGYPSTNYTISRFLSCTASSFGNHKGEAFAYVEVDGDIVADRRRTLNKICNPEESELSGLARIFSNGVAQASASASCDD